MARAAREGDFADLAAPARRALANAGYRQVADLAAATAAEVAQLHGMGPNAMARLRDKLTVRGLTFASER